LTKLAEFSKKYRIGVVFIQPEFPKHTAEALARDIGAPVAATDPLVYDFEKNLKNFIAILKSGEN